MTLAFDKIVNIEQALAWREDCYRSWEKVVLTNGCYDIITRGHTSCLEQARNLGDRLIVLVNSDRAVKLLKGPTRPVNNEFDRMFVLAGFEAVSRVCLVDDMRITKALEALKPNLWIKGADYNLETLNQSERKAVESNGGEIRFIEYLKNYSTTNLLNKLAKQ